MRCAPALRISCYSFTPNQKIDLILSSVKTYMFCTREKTNIFDGKMGGVKARTNA